ncbi:hypothetical protein [Sphingobacterium endophyticum]|uniref:hypothetical protein n=1 Tax=Sphingobacterium endophyticum TaxID=2546448 RepID=UPI0012E2F3AF|nr:hypothetical protein [Sphingobacterium endophyticum]
MSSINEREYETLQSISFALARIESLLSEWEEKSEGSLMGAKEIGLRLGLPTQSVWRMARLKAVGYYRIGNRYMFNYKEFKASRYVKYVQKFHKRG